MVSIPRIFETIGDAEAARQELMAAGFADDRIALTARHDEAGPVEGNFVVGNTKRDTVEQTEFSEVRGGDGDNTYRHNFEQTVDRGMFLLVVDAEENELAKATAILDRHGAVDVDRLVGDPGA